MISALLPIAQNKEQVVKNNALTQEDHETFTLLKSMTTSKKDDAIRAHELFKIAQKPLEMFFEEKLQYYLQAILEQPVLRALCQAICYCKIFFI